MTQHQANKIKEMADDLQVLYHSFLQRPENWGSGVAYNEAKEKFENYLKRLVK
ncbi:hypothetical protein KNT87_gp187 [Erwinia phage Cronus]|uniref:Uncharacterized protein n=1 Tax=Erwinia phage Cronus TaxID=2163633 RepID=A0A2S1GLX6_9CAUD|nr:hypothetical protein KNT87_gp187 [Erwinia phage Cronus]AWD90382.1 hypothetical protein [Erwinia phage Cronus]